MQLFYSDASPYARKVRVVLAEAGHGDAVALRRCNPLDDPADLIAANPLAKVPTLLTDDGTALIDSLAIVLFLQKVLAMPVSLAFAGADNEQLQRHAVANGITDAALALVLEGRREPSERSAYWQARWQRAITRSLQWFDETRPAGDRFDLGDVALAIALEYLDFRLPDLDWRSQAPGPGDWLADVAERSSMRSTRPA